MKKFIILILSVVLCVSVFTIAGCANTGDLEDRIAQLEHQLADGGFKGDTGEQGPQGEPGEDGNPWVADNKIYKLGETFTYVSQGLELFSVKVDPHPSINGDAIITAKNSNMPGYAPCDFIRVRYFVTSSFVNMSVSDTIMPVGAEYAVGGGSTGSGEYLYLGFPTSNNAMITYAVYRVR